MIKEALQLMSGALCYVAACAALGAFVVYKFGRFFR